MGWEQTASGYAAVWAMENTREALFDAMERKETYATTGPRLVVRFFGGWDFEERDVEDRLPARVGYGKGVPMGGDLERAPRGTSPTFPVAALKDPVGANLDRIQVVKGWVTEDGETHEKVHDVVWSGDRRPGADGYARVLEIPTPRWTAYDAKYFGIDLPKDVPMTTQERAYTSPIWYTP